MVLAVLAALCALWLALLPKLHQTDTLKSSLPRAPSLSQTLAMLFIAARATSELHKRTAQQ
jgi:hypothetical protein